MARLFALIVLAVVAWDAAALWRDLSSWGGTRDWLYFYFLAEVDRRSILDFGQFPLWNPYYCGGAVHLANPQTFFLSPTLLPILAFGTPVGIRLMLTATLLLSLDGMRRLARRLGIGEAGAWLAGGAWALSGTVHLHLGGGHVGWVGFALVPYVLLALSVAVDASDGGARPDVTTRRRALVGGGLVLAWILGHFGVYQFPYTCILLAVYGGLAGWRQRRWTPWLRAAASMIALAVLVMAVRVLPLVEFIRSHPRVVSDNTMVSPLDWWEILVVRHADLTFADHGWSWPEYGNYVGPFGVALMIAGAVVARRRRPELVPVALGAGAFLIFAMGSVPLFPWWFLKHLPLLVNLRVPERFIIFVSLFGALLAGLALDELSRPEALRARGRTRAVALLAVLLGLAFLVDCAQFNRRHWHRSFGTPPPALVDAGPDRDPGFHQRRGDKDLMYAYPRSERGTIDCFEESPLDISPRLRGDLRDEEYLDDPAAGAVRRIAWSPNRLELDVEVSRPARVIVNQNFGPGWRAEGAPGTAAEPWNGLLSAPVPAGHHRLVLRYLPTSFLVGAAISAAALLACLALMVAPRRKAPL